MYNLSTFVLRASAFFLFLGFKIAFGQLVIDKTSHDFGDVKASSIRTVDFHIINQYGFPVILSSHIFDFELSTTYAPISLEPNDTLIYRIQIRPSKKGHFEKTIPITFYSTVDTFNLRLTANVLTTKFDDTTPLERFSDKPGKNDEPFKEFPISICVLDEETKQPITDASISFYAKSSSYKTFKTDKQGMVTSTLTNRYDVSIYAYQYKSRTVGISLGCEDSVRTIYLQRSGIGYITDPEDRYAYEEENPITTPHSITDITSTEEEKLLEPLTAGNYKPNNIVFLMDVSISMKDHDRMKLLKAAIIQLINLMRPQDNVSIITFSKDTKIVVEPSVLDGGNKADIIRIVKSLKPGGLTNGGRGLKVAFKLIQENYSVDKNNQVILATDGALGSYMDHDDILKLVKKNQIYATTSVVTLNGYNWSQQFMTEIARTGKGRLLPINNELEAKLMLIKDIKENSIIQTVE